MKEMVYGKDRIFEVLDKGTYKGYDYLIISYGTHPCCYIHIPRESSLYCTNYNDIDLCVHGGLTFGDFFSGEIANELGIPCDNWYIGWDYAHCDDYCGYFNETYRDGLNLRVWTIEMLLDEVQCAIDDLKELPIKLKPYVWYPCNDETDVAPEENQERIYYSDGVIFRDCDCSLGWKSLVRNGAKVMIIEKPE